MTEYTETDDGRVKQTNGPVNEDTDLEVIGAEEAFFVQRDDDGDLVARPQEIPGSGGKAVRVKPASSGVYNEYLDPVEWENDEKMAELFNKQYPDLNVTAQDLENDLLSFSAQTMVQLIRKASGEDMQSALEEEQNRQEIQQMMDLMGVEQGEADMGDLMEVMMGLEGGAVTAEQLTAAAEQHDLDPETATVADLANVADEAGEGENAVGTVGPNSPTV